MGMRGPGAQKGKVADITSGPLRKVLPWEDGSLSRVEAVIAFLEDLPVTQGKLAGTKFKMRDWQREWLENVYAVDADGNRPVRTAILSVARKNGKSALIAGLALCHLMGPEAEMRGEVYAAANDKAQAGKIFAEMEAILLRHGELLERANVKRFNKQIEVLEGQGKGSLFAALSADATTKMGLSPSFTVVDEAGTAPNRHLFDALDTAQGARDEPLTVVISTQAPDDTHFFSEMVDYGEKIAAGEIVDASFYSKLYAASATDSPWDVETWKAANPALGDFRSLADVERQAMQAQRVPSKENSFRNLICNERISAHSRFVQKAEWDSCAGAIPDDLKGREAYGALDLSGGRDLSALVWVFPCEDGGFDVLPRFWLPADGIAEKSDTDRVPYDVWAREGHLTLMPGKTIDPAFIAEALAQDAVTFDVRTVAYDRWRIEDLRRELSAIGGDVPLSEHGQGFRDMSPAVDALERAVAEGLLRHGGQPVLQMCAANAIVTVDAAGGRKLDKSKAAGRIDGLVALAMALSVAARHDEAELPACLLAA